MYKNFKISLILLLSGKGIRFQSETPKQFHGLSGKKVYLHSLDAFYNLKIIDEIILVAPRDWIEKIKKEISNYKNIKIIPGGNRRQKSSYLGLLACNSPDFVIFHDAVRPFVSKKIILNNLDAVIKHKAVNTCIKANDTLVQINADKKIEKIPDRSYILRGQTPQTFEYNLILNAHKEAANKNSFNATDDCQLVISKMNIYVVNGDEDNIKITTKSDLYLAKELLKLKNLSS